MWTALENIAVRQSLPRLLETGESVRGVLVTGRDKWADHALRHRGRRHSKSYLLKQFYSMDVEAFLRWQNEARWMQFPAVPGYVWPEDEWRGGVITPYPEGRHIDCWLDELSPGLGERLDAAARIAASLAGLHGGGVAHRGLAPWSVQVGRRRVWLTDFGRSCCGRLDDFWADSKFPSSSKDFAAPETFRGGADGFAADVHAFGALFSYLLTGRGPFGVLRAILRPMLPIHVLPSLPPVSSGYPDAARAIVSACLASRPKDRPTMAAVAERLGEYLLSGEPCASFSLPEQEALQSVPSRIMVFVKNDHRAGALFDAALGMASQKPSLFLVVGLVPSNLPSGHVQRFKGGLFRKLAQGLLRMRGASAQWSLRLFEGVDPITAARTLIHQYRPDQVLMGETSPPSGLGRLKRRFADAVAETGARFHLCR